MNILTYLNSAGIVQNQLPLEWHLSPPIRAIYQTNKQFKNKEPREPITSETAAIHAKKVKQIMTKLKSIMTTNYELMGKYYNKNIQIFNFQMEISSC